MTDTSRLYTLEKVIQTAIAEDGGDKSKHKKFLKLAIEGYKELRLHTMQGSDRFTKVTPNALNRVTFPEDMLEFIAIGVPVDGKFYPLTRDNSIIKTYTTAQSGETSLDEEDGEGVDLPTTVATNIRASGGINIYGYYAYDEENDCIIVNATSRSELLLNYLTSGISTETTQIPMLAVPALVAYILWQDKEQDRNAPDNVIARFERRWLREEHKLHIKNMSIDTIKDTIARTRNMLGS